MSGEDAILLGAIGGPKWSAPDAKVRPESGLLGLRKALGTFANLRPVTIHPALRGVSTLRPEVLEGVDLMFVRELTGGIYFGEKTRTPEQATDLCTYTVAEVERVTRVACRLARGRRGKRDLHRQIQRSGDLATVARSVSRGWSRSEFADIAARAHSGGCRRHAPDPQAARF